MVALCPSGQALGADGALWVQLMPPRAQTWGVSAHPPGMGPGNPLTHGTRTHPGGTGPAAAETQTPCSGVQQKAFNHGTGRAGMRHGRMRAAPPPGSLPPHPTAGALPACPGRVGEDDVPPLGPAGEDGFLGDEAVAGAVGSLVYQVHPALVQPALLEVVVGHA